MELSEAIQYAKEGRAVLFAGSGFCYDVVNINGARYPLGNKLADRLASACGVKTGKKLGDAAEHFLNRKSKVELIDELKEIFSLLDESKDNPLEYLKPILSLKWKGVFTTNYDRVIECVSNKVGKVITPVILEDNLDDSKKNNFCLHINGFIERLDEESLDSSFKLTNRSYDIDGIASEPWIEFMRACFESSKVIFIVGFSMGYDLDLRRIISSPEYKDKLVFISSAEPDEDDELLRKYGTVENIGVHGFSERIINFIKNNEVVCSELPIFYECFQYDFMTPTSAQDSVLYENMVDLFFKGRLIDSHLYKNYVGEYKFLVMRNKVDKLVEYIFNKPKKIYLVLSSLGNGKSIFIELLKNELRCKDTRIYHLKRNGLSVKDEVEDICKNLNKKIIIIDNYHQNFNVLNEFRLYNNENTIFVLTSRISLYKLNKRKIMDLFRISNTQIHPIHIDELEDNELEMFASILYEYKFSSTKIHGGSAEEVYGNLKLYNINKVSEIILEVFGSSYIIDEFKKLYDDGIRKDINLKKLAVSLMIKQYMNLNLTYQDILYLLNIDHYRLFEDENIFMGELFNFRDNDMEFKSSIIAHYFLYKIIEFDDFVEVLILLATCIDKMMNAHRKYIDVMKGLISHTHFVPFLKNGCGHEKIADFYNNISRLEFCKNNLFFFEQFASSYIDARKYDKAEICLNSAYRLAERQRWFVPFQIETINARLIIERFTLESQSTLFDAEEVISVFDRALKLLFNNFSHPDNNHQRIYKECMKFTNMTEMYIEYFDKRQLSILIEKFRFIYKKMNDDKVDYSVNEKLQQIQEVIEKLKKPLRS